MGWGKKVVFMVDGGDGMREECSCYGGWRGGDGEESRFRTSWW